MRNYHPRPVLAAAAAAGEEGRGRKPDGIRLRGPGPGM